MSRAAEKADRTIGWSRLPRPLALAVLVGLRHQLRAYNLYDAGRGAADRPPDDGPVFGNRLGARTLNGTCNDVDDPLMGSLGSRFGRNVPPEYTYPEDPEALLEPNPRLISRRLLGRDDFQPATTLNLLAAAWIQFEVHDWFSHGTVDTQPWQIPLHDHDPWPQRPMTIKRAAPDPSPDPQGPPTFVTGETHWWDASQIYGSTPEFCAALRTGHHGQLKLDQLGLPPIELERHLDLTGAAGNFWVGLAMLHSLFMREHNAICDRLAQCYPQLGDQELYDKARLVNAALIAKIHTIDWTPAIIAHPTTVLAMRANWFGVLGERFRRRFGRITDSEVLQGIPGSPTNHHGVPYSLTEEFVAVYRMHPLIPDTFLFRSLADDCVVAEHEFSDLTLRHVRERLDEIPMAHLFYSFGRAHPGALTLHNFPRQLQHFERPDGSLIDLAATDILRVREHGVPRYNEFRRLLRLKPVSSFDELTDNPVWAQELRQIYTDVEQVNLMVGLYAEPKPRGFGFSDTAFRIFVLMASRRLASDRFFTRDFRPEVYTQAGLDWVADNDMRSVLLRHFPALEPALAGVANPFAPWHPVGAPPSAAPKAPAGGAAPDYVRYREDLEQPRPDENEVIERITAALRHNNERAYRKFKHGLRDAHAKSHAILRGELSVYPDLPEELAQGLFAAPATYPVIARISTTSGVLRSDQIRGVRGLAIKVLGVRGPRALADDDATTQDFIMVTHREFLFADAHAYLAQGMPTARVLAMLPDRALWAGSEVLAAATRVGMRLPPNLAVFIAPNTHILGETFFSSAPLRYGDYVAKMLYAPLSDSVKNLQGRRVPRDAGPEAHRDLMIDFFADQGAEYELRVQLCTDTATMPIEDATVAWPEEESPHRPVAKITFPPQNPCSPQRRAFGDDVLSFNSWRALADHRPLGSINRLKLQVYEASSQFRHHVNAAPRLEPVDIGQLPD